MSDKDKTNTLPEHKHDNLASWGLRITWVYLIILVGGIPVAGMLGAINIRPLDLNELGDFLAGAFGPLAIAWLVLGFFQQGQELKNSVDALRLQAEELSKSVEQQVAMVGITEKQLDLDIAVRDEQVRSSVSRELPLLRCASGGNGSSAKLNARYFTFRLINIGPDATDVTLFLDDAQIQKDPRELGMIANKQQKDFRFNIPLNPDGSWDWEANLTVLSVNIRGKKREQIFRIGNFRPEVISCIPENV